MKKLVGSEKRFRLERSRLEEEEEVRGAFSAPIFEKPGQVRRAS
jgi:hypothetical protein